MIRRRQHGATMTEFVVIAPLIVLIGLTGLQLAQLYQARLNLEYAVFEAARAGVRDHASPESIRSGFVRGLLPLLASTGQIPGHPSASQLRTGGIAYRATLEGRLAPSMQVEILTPGPADFDDFADPALQQVLHTRQRVIPNDRLDTRPVTPGARSGHSLQAANRLRLRIIWGFEPRIPLARTLFTSGTSLLAGQASPFRQALLAAGRLPLESEVTLPMLTPAVENGLMRPGGSGPAEHPHDPPGPEDGGAIGDSPPSPSSGPGATSPATECPAGADGDLCCAP